MPIPVSECKHEWEKEYYGDQCKKCGLFVPDGCGPWMPEDTDDPTIYRRCEVCGGEFWDGGTSCTCID